MIIKPQLTKVQTFTVSGISVTTKNEDEFNPDTARIPGLWEQFFKQQLNTNKSDEPIYGVYHNYESDVFGVYSVTAGVETSDEVQNHLLDKIIIEPGNYLVFEAKGPIPAAIIEAWQSVWNYFNEETEWQRSYHTDFEVYKNANESAVYIGVK